MDTGMLEEYCLQFLRQSLLIYWFHHVSSLIFITGIIHKVSLPYWYLAFHELWQIFVSLSTDTCPFGISLLCSPAAGASLWAGCLQLFPALPAQPLVPSLVPAGLLCLDPGLSHDFPVFSEFQDEILGSVKSSIWAEVLWSFLTLLWHILMGQGCDLLRARQLLLCGDQTQPQVFSQKGNWPEISLLKQGEMQFPFSISLNKDHSGDFWTSFSSVKVPWNGGSPSMELLQWHIKRFLSLKGSLSDQGQPCLLLIWTWRW